MSCGLISWEIREDTPSSNHVSLLARVCTAKSGCFSHLPLYFKVRIHKHFANLAEFDEEKGALQLICNLRATRDQSLLKWFPVQPWALDPQTTLSKQDQYQG